MISWKMFLPVSSTSHHVEIEFSNSEYRMVTSSLTCCHLSLGARWVYEQLTCSLVRLRWARAVELRWSLLLMAYRSLRLSVQNRQQLQWRAGHLGEKNLRMVFFVSHEL